ncbi:uncharacterized protein G2W53_031342 [Senna tora]|uniref:Uncharacterized protein n=1 Tax=Senna tora TaxID=362788 RepID=A0A834T7X2_9FABA|nr:uncharacterized protein G2W53_031342 [Senna tora]
MGDLASLNAGGRVKEERRDDDFFRDRTPHRAVMMAMLAARVAARNESCKSGCMNGRLLLWAGIVLPITAFNFVKFKWYVCARSDSFLTLSLVFVYTTVSWEIAGFFLGKWQVRENEEKRKKQVFLVGWSNPKGIA